MVTYGGAERMTFAALGALAEAGAAVRSIVNEWAQEPVFTAAASVGSMVTATGYRMPLSLRIRRPGEVALTLRDMIVTNSRLIWEVLRFRPTHVLVPAHDIVLRHWPVLLLLRMTRISTVMRLCNAPVQTAFYRWLWKWGVNGVVNHFVCNSRFTQTELLACGVSKRKTTLIQNALPVERRDAGRTSSTRGRLVFVGQIIPPKGLHVLLDAVGEMVARGANVTLDVVGNINGWTHPVFGDYKEQLKLRAARPDLDGRVCFLGWRQDVLEVISQAELHCCPSLPEIRESFGLVVLEAKLAGVPSVVFRSGALPEIVTDGVDGWICESPTSAALAARCLEVLGDRQALAAAAEAARQSASRFDGARFASSWRTVMGIPAGDGTSVNTGPST
jgi:glycosyltransferase involved in cell wall biosynthesis